MKQENRSRHNTNSLKGWRLTYCCTFLATLLMLSCSTSKQSSTSTTSTEAKACTPYAKLTTSERQRLNFFYQEATKQKMLGNHVAAYDLFQHCLDICPDAPDALYQLGIYRLLLHEDSLALNLLSKAAAIDPTNTYYKETLAGYYLEHRDVNQALPQLETLAKLQPKRTDVLSQLVRLYAGMERPADAIRTLDRIEVLEGKIASVSFQKFSLYKGMGEEKKAFGELEALCKEYPHEMSYRLAIGSQLLNADHIDEARKVFAEVQRIEPENPQLQLSLLELYRATAQDSLYLVKRDSLLYAPKTESDIRITLLRDVIATEMRTDSTGPVRVNNTFDRLLAEHPRDISLWQLKAAYLITYEQQNDSAFVNVMDRVHELEPDNTQALIYLIQYYGEHKEFEQLENLCRRGVLTHPEELICHFYLGVALYQQDKKAESLKAFQDGVLHKTEESRATMVADMFSIMGDVLYQLGREAEAFAAYDSCLTYQADNAGCLNNYAYYLSLRDSCLDQAEEMSYRTIRLEPANKTYLDTYAWILFMKGNYHEAQIYIDRVCPPDSTDSVLLADDNISGVVLEHAGDIAACNGLPEQALRFWLLAQQAGGEDLTAVLPKKIKLKKYIK